MVEGDGEVEGWTTLGDSMAGFFELGPPSGDDDWDRLAGMRVEEGDEGPSC